MKYDSVLLVAFGGPTPGCCQKYNSDACPGEAYCFVEGIAGEAESQRERVKDISAHYVKLGGFSPFNELTFKQADALKTALQARDLPLPVYAGFRHWNPYLKEVIAEMAEKGHRKILGIIMAPHQSKVSWEWYQQTVKKGIDAVDGEKPTVDYLDPWYTHEGYIGAIAEIIETACGNKLERAELVFTAHAIPQAAANTSPYTQQFGKTGEAVAEQIGKTRFGLAYQSEVENSPLPWTQPDINDWLKARREEGVDTVVASPIGFLCDHVEVLYDLDIEAAETAEACGIDFIRAGTVGDHPKFINMLADFVCGKVAKEK
ncbi:MAG: ferrochelatase [Candidatus Poribacteria bacterium]|nr:ferrochelatase [Candidatus Poribacteria bacterium]